MVLKARTGIKSPTRVVAQGLSPYCDQIETDLAVRASALSLANDLRSEYRQSRPVRNY
jgi:hypothetical protein